MTTVPRGLIANGLRVPLIAQLTSRHSARPTLKIKAILDQSCPFSSNPRKSVWKGSSREISRQQAQDDAARLRWELKQKQQRLAWAESIREKRKTSDLRDTSNKSRQIRDAIAAQAHPESQIATPTNDVVDQDQISSRPNELKSSSVSSHLNASKSMPIKEYNSRFEASRTEEKYTWNAQLLQKDRGLEVVAGQILSSGLETPLYIAPKGRWKLTAVAVGVLVVGAIILLPITFDVVDAVYLGNSNWLLRCMQTAIITLVGGLIWIAYSSRTMLVKRITLLPRKSRRGREFWVRVEGRGWIPFTTAKVETELSELRVNKYMTKMPVFQKRQRKLDEYFNLQRPFVWAYWTISDILEEMSFMYWPSTQQSSCYMKLWTNKDRQVPMEQWWIDQRAYRLLKGPEGFEYFVETEENKANAIVGS